MLKVEPVILEGSRLRLEPLAEEHLAGLYEVADPAIFEFMMMWYAPSSLDDIKRNFEQIRKVPGILPFAMVSRESGNILGTSSFFDIRPEHGALEVGATWIGRDHQGTSVNPEAKLLMLSHAFESLGCIRVQLKTDARNMHSRRAMEKLGAKFEGILRQHMIRPDGFRRDSAYYSILDTEWPDVKRGLEMRLSER